MVGNFGQPDLHSYISFGDNAPQFFSELLGGGKVRLKINVNNLPYYLRFGLNGSTTSLQKAKQLCDQFSTNPNAGDDKSFFEKDSKPTQKYNSNSSKSDEQYF